MLSEAQLYKNYFEQNEPLVLTLPGGIYTWEETGRLGISFTNTPYAFNKALLLPCILIKTKELLATEEVNDEAEQAMSFRRTGQIFIYQEGGTAILEEVFNIVYNLIQNKQPFPGVRTMITQVIEGGQEESLNGANFIRIDFVERGIKVPN